jgi:hypothetical protein
VYRLLYAKSEASTEYKYHTTPTSHLHHSFQKDISKTSGLPSYVFFVCAQKRTESLRWLLFCVRNRKCETRTCMLFFLRCTLVYGILAKVRFQKTKSVDVVSVARLSKKKNVPALPLWLLSRSKAYRECDMLFSVCLCGPSKTYQRAQVWCAVLGAVAALALTYARRRNEDYEIGPL